MMEIQKYACKPRIDSIEPVASTKWLALQTISYTDPSGVSRTWDMVTRTTKPKKESGDSDSGVNVNVNQNLADAVTIKYRRAKYRNVHRSTRERVAEAI